MKHSLFPSSAASYCMKVIVLLLLINIYFAHAAIYYVSTSGKDTNNGLTKATAFSTVHNGAAKVAKPGDSIYLVGGTYKNTGYGDGNIWKNGLAYVPVRIKSMYGNATHPITVSPAPGEYVKIQFDSQQGIQIQDCTWVKVTGFEVEGAAQKINLTDALANQFVYRIDTNSDGSLLDETNRYRDPNATLIATISSLGGQKPAYYNANAVTINSGSNHIEISNMIIHDSTGHGIASMGGAEYVTVRNNTIYNNLKWTSEGNHAISFKGVASSDTFDGVKILVENNHLYNNSNLLISWATLKTMPVTMAIDEGKGIHFQNINTDSGWYYGKILVINNLVERSGNAGITANDASNLIIVQNKIVDCGYINNYMKQGLADPNVDPGFAVVAGGLRLAGAYNIRFSDNVIIITQPSLNPVDATSDVTSSTAIMENNVYVGGSDPFFRSADAILAASFKKLT